MKTLSIKNYKNLKDLQLDNLRRVNLIVGNNNVGKSTLLEAIAINNTSSFITTIFEILENRGENIKFRDNRDRSIDKEIESFCSLFTDRDVSGFYHEGIILNTVYNDNQASTLQLRLQKYERITIEEGEEMRVMRVPVPSNTPLSENVSLSLMVTENDKILFRYILDGMIRQPLMADTGNYEYVKTSQITSSRNAELFDNIALTSLEDEIVNALKIIDERVEKINFLKVGDSLRDSNRVPFVVLRNDSNKYRLSSMGDGINRILTIVLSLLNCKEGVLLIDEFENGLHHSAQTQLWKIVNELAERLDVQVFATTHSNDCIRSFAKADKKGEGLIIRLQQSAKGIEPIYFTDYKEVLFALDNDIDIR